MAVKKNKLVIAPFDDIQIIGINAPMADYKLAYHFNEAFHFSFIRLKEVLLDDVLPYAFFYYNAGENRNTYDLVSLKYKDHRCVKLNPQLDYLLIVRNPITDARIEQVIKNIRGIEGVVHAFAMDLSRTPAIDVLLERIEMHERHCLEELNS